MNARLRCGSGPDRRRCLRADLVTAGAAVAVSIRLPSTLSPIGWGVGGAPWESDSNVRPAPAALPLRTRSSASPCRGGRSRLPFGYRLPDYRFEAGRGDSGHGRPPPAVPWQPAQFSPKSASPSGAGSAFRRLCVIGVRDSEKSRYCRPGFAHIEDSLSYINQRRHCTICLLARTTPAQVAAVRLIPRSQESVHAGGPGRATRGAPFDRLMAIG